jgi:ABC-2 type transport system ATP-binding protein
MLEDLRKSQQSRVIVQPADAGKLATALQEAEISNIQPLADGKIAIPGVTVQQIGDVAAKAGVALYGVQEEKADLEQLFFRLTSGQYAAPGQVPHGQLPQVPPGGYGTPPGGYAQPAGAQQAYQQQPFQQPGYQSPPQGYPQQPGYQPTQQQYPPQGYQQPGYQQQSGWAPPSGPQPAQQPGTPPGGWGPPSGPQPTQQAPPPPEQDQQQPGQGGTGGNA